jgi:hypothetical protein
MVRCRAYFKLPIVIISSLNGKKCVVGNKKCKSLGLRALYGETAGEVANECYLRTSL